MPKHQPNPKVVEQLSKVSEIDWARMAAYVDGEGCITVYASDSTRYNPMARSPKFTISIVVANTDPRMIAWIHERFGGFIHVRKQQKSKWRVAYHWGASAITASLILRGIKPYLVTKGEQADVALAVAATMQKHNGRVPEEVTSHRRELCKQLTEMKRHHFPEDFKFAN